MLGRTNAEGNTLDMDLLTAAPGDVASGKKFAGTGSDEIQTGTLALNGNATNAQVLKGRTFYNNDLKTKQVGAMPEIPSQTKTLNCGNSYNIPLGYHDGKGKVVANSLASQTSATLADSKALAGKTFWKDGVKRTGTLIDRGAPNLKLGINDTINLPAGRYTGGKIAQTISTMGGQTITPGVSSKTISCSGKYMTGNIIISGDTDLIAANIRKGKNIFGIVGTAEVYDRDEIILINGSTINNLLGGDLPLSIAANFGKATRLKDSAGIGLRADSFNQQSGRENEWYQCDGAYLTSIRPIKKSTYTILRVEYELYNPSGNTHISYVTGYVYLSTQKIGNYGNIIFTDEARGEARHTQDGSVIATMDLDISKLPATTEYYLRISLRLVGDSNSFGGNLPPWPTAGSYFKVKKAYFTN